MYQVPGLSQGSFLSFLIFALRFASLIELGLVGRGLARTQAGPRVRRLWSLYVVTAACYLAGPFLMILLPRGIRPALLLGAFASPWVFWAFSRHLFREDFRLGRPGLALLAAVEAASFLAYPGKLVAWLSLGIDAVIFWQAFALRYPELPERRRRAARRIVGFHCAALLFINLAGLYSRGAPMAQALELPLQLAILFCVSRIAHAVATDGAALFGPAASRRRRDPFGEEFVARFERLADGDQLFREGQNLAQVSRLLESPEYRVREYLHERLGFRNFNEFLNAKRVDRAQRMLESSEGEPAITTIAFEVGYRSLATFNRAFKARSGLSPSEYRRAHREARSASPR